MNKRKHDHSKESFRVNQRGRTQRNQIKRYEKLIKENPDDNHIKEWKRKLLEWKLK